MRKSLVHKLLERVRGTTQGHFDKVRAYRTSSALVEVNEFRRVAKDNLPTTTPQEPTEVWDSSPRPPGESPKAIVWSNAWLAGGPRYLGNPNSW